MRLRWPMGGTGEKNLETKFFSCRGFASARDDHETWAPSACARYTALSKSSLRVPFDRTSCVTLYCCGPRLTALSERRWRALVELKMQCMEDLFLP